MTLSDSLFTFADTTYNLIVTNAVTLDLADVFWGDQDKIPRTSAACIEPVMKTRELAGVPRRTDVPMELYVMVYHAKIQDVQVTTRECVIQAEAIETLLHQDAQMGGLFIHTLVTAIEPGFARRTATLFRSTRITFTALSKVSLPQSA